MIKPALASLFFILSVAVLPAAASSDTALQCLGRNNVTRIITFNEHSGTVAVDGSRSGVWVTKMDGFEISFTHTTNDKTEWEVRIVRSNGAMTTFNKTKQRPGGNFFCSQTIPRRAF